MAVIMTAAACDQQHLDRLRSAFGLRGNQQACCQQGHGQRKKWTMDHKVLSCSLTRRRNSRANSAGRGQRSATTYDLKACVTLQNLAGISEPQPCFGVFSAQKIKNAKVQLQVRKPRVSRLTAADSRVRKVVF